MSLTHTIEILRFSSPIIVQFICILLLLRGFRWGNERSRKRLTSLLVIVKICSIMAWLGIVCYLYAPVLYVYLHGLFYLSMLLNSVLFYQFVHILTQTDKQRDFSRLHYLMPLVIVGALVAWSLAMPFDTQLYIIVHNGEKVKGHELFSIFYSSKLPVNAAYHLFYITLEFLRLYRYRKAITNYSADISANSMHWLYVFMFTAVLAIPLTAGSAIIPRQSFLGSVFILIPVGLVMFQGIIVTYNMIMGKYVIIYDNDSYPFSGTVDNKNADVIRKLEWYMQTHKPYRNPKLKITDLSPVLSTNRSRLSQLINQHYGMNFCSWINHYRLNEVYALSQQSTLSEVELVESAGFSNYRSYARFKKHRGSQGVEAKNNSQPHYLRLS